MKHLETLSSEERAVVSKFQEYGATLVVGFGNKSSWSDLVHTNAYSDELISSKLQSLTGKVAQQDLMRDSDDDVNDTEFITRDGGNNVIKFTTKDCQLFLRGVRKVRKAFSNLKAVNELDIKIADLKLKTMSKEERLKSNIEQLQNERNALLGIKSVENTTEATPTTEIK